MPSAHLSTILMCLHAHPHSPSEAVLDTWQTASNVSCRLFFFLSRLRWCFHRCSSLQTKSSCVHMYYNSWATSKPHCWSHRGVEYYHVWNGFTLNVLQANIKAMGHCYCTVGCCSKHTVTCVLFVVMRGVSVCVCVTFKPQVSITVLVFVSSGRCALTYMCVWGWVCNTGHQPVHLQLLMTFLICISSLILLLFSVTLLFFTFWFWCRCGGILLPRCYIASVVRGVLMYAASPPFFLSCSGGFHGSVRGWTGLSAEQLEHFGWLPGFRVFDWHCRVHGGWGQDPGRASSTQAAQNITSS